MSSDDLSPVSFTPPSSVVVENLVAMVVVDGMVVVGVVVETMVEVTVFS